MASKTNQAPAEPPPRLTVAPFIDSHCHLQSLEPDERQPAIDAARARGVRGFLIPSIEIDDAPLLLELCHANDDMWCAVGHHPNSAESWPRGAADRLHALASDPKVVAIGECGLDFFHQRASAADQERAMREQWEVAVDLGLPVVVHNRDSNDAMLAAWNRPEFDTLQADFHSFAGGLKMAEELAERGAYFGLSGMVTFNRADNVREILGRVPPERLLVETDTPYLAPVPYRGQPNRPAYVAEVLERLAGELGLDVAAAAALTTENFFRLFERAAST